MLFHIHNLMRCTVSFQIIFSHQCNFFTCSLEFLSADLVVDPVEERVYMLHQKVRGKTNGSITVVNYDGSDSRTIIAIKSIQNHSRSLAVDRNQR